LRPHSIIRVLAAAVLLAVPSIAMAAPDQNTNNGQYNNCNGGRWVNGQCVYNNGQYNNGQWNNNGRHRQHGDDNNDRDDHRDNGRHNGWNNPNNPHNGNYNGNYNGGYNGNYNGGYNGNYNGGYSGGNGYGRGQLTGTVSSFSPYNLYLSNGLHVELHDGTVINPRGTNLSPGMRVRVIGNRNSDGTFNANEIDVIGNGGYRY
jgi:hypothetical protein